VYIRLGVLWDPVERRIRQDLKEDILTLVVSDDASSPQSE
jgi:hypothetical protein